MKKYIFSILLLILFVKLLVKENISDIRDASLPTSPKATDTLTLKPHKSKTIDPAYVDKEKLILENSFSRIQKNPNNNYEAEESLNFRSKVYDSDEIFNFFKKYNSNFPFLSIDQGPKDYNTDSKLHLASSKHIAALNGCYFFVLSISSELKNRVGLLNYDYSPSNLNIKISYLRSEKEWTQLADVKTDEIYVEKNNFSTSLIINTANSKIIIQNNISQVNPIKFISLINKKKKRLYSLQAFAKLLTCPTYLP